MPRPSGGGDPLRASCRDTDLRFYCRQPLLTDRGDIGDGLIERLRGPASANGFRLRALTVRTRTSQRVTKVSGTMYHHRKVEGRHCRVRPSAGAQLCW